MATSNLCHACGSPIRQGLNRCPHCGKYNFLDSGTKDRRNFLSQVNRVKISRIQSGPWDPCFGGGLVKWNVNLLAGERGAGKSTLLLQMAEIMTHDPTCNRTHPVLYVATEENDEQIAARADRLGLTAAQDSILLVNAMGGMNLVHLLEETTPFLIILDSLPGFTGNTKKEDSIAIIQAVKRYATKHHCPSIVIDHMTKEHDPAGYEALFHAVDSVLVFRKEDGGKVRVLITDKNRDGPAPVEVRFKMTASGLTHLPSPTH